MKENTDIQPNSTTTGVLQIPHLQAYRKTELRLLNNEQDVQGSDTTMMPIAVLARPVTNILQIKKTARIAVFLLFTIYFLFSARAQTFTTSVSATTIGKNQYAEVTYEMANAATIDNFQAPQFKDWLVVSGPNNSSYQSNINGQVSQRTTISYYLQPKKTGQLLVEGATVVLNGKPMTSKPKLVQVLDKEVSDQQQPGANTVDPFGNLLNDPFFAQPPVVQVVPKADEFADAMILRPGESAPEKIKNNLFIKVIPDKNTCYEGEPVMATYKVFTRLDIDASVTKRPSFSGFSAYDLEEPNQPFIIEEIGGKKYKSWVLRKVQLYPLQSGKLTLEPVEVECKIRFAKGEMMAAGTYDPYSDNSFTNVQYVLKSPAISITSLPLPEAGKPRNFGGAVGSFSIAATTGETAPGKDDAVRLQVHITGNGNFSMVSAPAVLWPAATEAYEPTETENLVQTVMPISGEKTFEYAFVPHRAGPYTIPAISFSYFDIAAKAYKTVATQPITLSISPQSKRHNPPENDEAQNWPVLFSQIAGYVLPVLAAGLLLFLIFGFMGRKKKQQQAGEKAAMHTAWERMINETTTASGASIPATPPANVPPPVQHHNAYMPVTMQPQPVPADQIDEHPAPAVTDGQVQVGHMPVVPLQAETLIWQDDHRLFYKALKNDVLQTLSGKAGITSDNKITLLDALKVKGMDSNVLQQISSLYDECDAALYSPISTTANRHRTLEEAKFLLGELG